MTVMTGGLASPLLVYAIAAVALGVSLEASAISEALTNQRGMGITTRQAAGLRQYVYGVQRIGGVTIYESTTGFGNSGDPNHHYVVVLASHILDGIVNIFLDGRQVFFSQQAQTGFTNQHANIGCGTVTEPPVTSVTISGGVITGITASTLGSGFNDVAPQDGYRVRIFDPGGGSGAEAWAYLVWNGGHTGVSFQVTIVDGGQNYTADTIADIQGAYTFGGTGANTQQDPMTKAVASTVGGSVVSVGSISSWWLDGFRYPAGCIPLVTFSGGGGYGAAAHCVMSGTTGGGLSSPATGGTILSIVVDDGGQDYTSVPDVTVGIGWTGVALSYSIGPGGADYSFGDKVYCEARFGDQRPSDYMGTLIAQELDGGSTNWYDTCNGTGCAYIYLSVGYDSSQFPNAPEIRVTVSGKPVFDPRTGDTAFSANWALQCADVITSGTSDNGLDDDSVNTAQLIAAANVCDELVHTSQGPEANFAQHIHWDSSTAVGDGLALMMPAAGGRISRIGGEWFLWPAYWQGPGFSLSGAGEGSYAFNGSNLTDDLKWEPYRSFRDLINVVNGTYIAPNSPYNVAGNLYDANGWYYGQTANLWPLAWQTTNYPSYACDVLHGYGSNIFQTEDNGIVLPKELSLRGVISIVQAQRLAKIDLLRNRQQGSGVMKMNLAAWQMIPTSVMQFTWAAMGWVNKYLEIDKIQLICEPQRNPETGEEGALAVGLAVTVQESDPSVYLWDISEELTPYDVEAIPLSPYTIPAPVSGVIVTSDITTALIQPDGTVIPRIELVWTEPADVYVVTGGQIEIQMCAHASAAWQDVLLLAGQTTVAFLGNVLAGVSYDVRLRAKRSNGASSDWVEIDAIVVGLTMGGGANLGTPLAPQALVGVALITGAEIIVEPFSATVGTVTVSCLPSGATTLTGLNQDQAYYVYWIDPTFSGGAITPIATQVSSDFAGKAGYFYIGSLVTPTYGVTGVYRPSLSADNGSRTTQTPSDAYDSDPTTYATLTAQNTTLAGQTYADCSYYGFPNLALGSSKTLTVIASLTCGVSANASTIQATIGGVGTSMFSASTTTAPASYTLTVPSATVLSTIQVEATAGSPMSVSGAVTVKLLIYDINIQ